ncbi:LamG-like jellyroll fold domain-containing protein [Flavobacterium sp. HNIBRBA15423]|uniref:LamG-like jellyroll fold domain-containing protein n=1 Tax=Flavobacterium sp. HNIBRBA15423 TaxID=3458683 RepID=UPI004043E303
MKNKLLFLKLFCAIVFLFSFKNQAQTLDQSNATGNESGFFVNNLNNNVGQSFVAGLTGDLTEFHIKIGDVNATYFTPGDFQFRLYNGEGIANPVLVTQNFTITSAPVNGYVEYTIVLPAGIAMVAGNTYTVNMRGITGSVLMVGTSPANYTSGGLYFNDGNSVLYNSYDLWFKTYVTQLPGASLNFDGINDYVTTATPLISNLTNFTIESWVYTDVTSYQTIYSEGNTTNDAPMFSLTRAADNTGFEIVLRNAFGVGLIVSSTNGFIPLNTWTHVVFSRTSATTAILYIDGVETDNFTFTDPGIIDVNVSTIGVRQRVFFDGFWNGNLDEMRIWDRALTECEIRDNLNAELPVVQTGLLAYYKFNQGIVGEDNTTVTTLIDEMGNINGTLQNFALNGTTSNWVTPGAVISGIESGIVASQTNVSCNGNLNGSATVNVIGGAGNYTYDWTPGTPTGDGTSSVSGLSAGVWICTITDALGCVRTQSFSITEPDVVNVPTGLSTQIYSGSGTLSDLVVIGNTIKWYSTASSIIEIPNSTVLVDGTTYYASQTVGACESPSRVAITVQKISEATQSFCSGATVNDLITTPSTDATVQWFSDANITTPLSGTAVLTSGSYYVEQTLPSSLINIANGLSVPAGIALDQAGNIYVSNAINNTIVRMDATGNNPVTLGSGFNFPLGVALDQAGNIYVADYGNGQIKKMDSSGNNITVILSGLNYPRSIAIDAMGYIYIVEENSSEIKKIDSSGNNLVTLGSGFISLENIALDNLGNIYLVDNGSQTIKKMDATGNNIITLGNGFNSPLGIALDNAGNIYIAEYSLIKKMDANGNNIQTIASGFSYARAIGINSANEIFIGNGNNNSIEKFIQAQLSNRVSVVVDITPSSENVTTITACDSYTWSNDGQTYTMSGTYTGITTNCITEKLDLTIISIDNTVSELTSGILTANETDATYQWYECPNTLLMGETNQDFTPTTIGDYKVEITVGSCMVESNCVTVTTLGTALFDEVNFKYYPNPTSGLVNISYSKLISQVTVMNMLGQTVFTKKENGSNLTLDLSILPSATYLVKVESEGQIKMIKIVKE